MLLGLDGWLLAVHEKLLEPCCRRAAALAAACCEGSHLLKACTTVEPAQRCENGLLKAWATSASRHCFTAEPNRTELVAAIARTDSPSTLQVLPIDRSWLLHGHLRRLEDTHPQVLSLRSRDIPSSTSP